MEPDYTGYEYLEEGKEFSYQKSDEAMQDTLGKYKVQKFSL